MPRNLQVETRLEELLDKIDDLKDMMDGTLLLIKEQENIFRELVKAHGKAVHEYAHLKTNPDAYVQASTDQLLKDIKQGKVKLTDAHTGQPLDVAVFSL